MKEIYCALSTQTCSVGSSKKGMMKKSFVIFGLIEAIPLPIFLIYAGLIDQSIPQNWQGP